MKTYDDGSISICVCVCVCVFNRGFEIVQLILQIVIVMASVYEHI